jgi:TPR repeat protein
MRRQWSIWPFFGRRGEGVRQDYDEARFWLRKAAEQGSAEAEQRLLSLPLKPEFSRALTGSARDHSGLVKNLRILTFLINRRKQEVVPKR